MARASAGHYCNSLEQTADLLSVGKQARKKIKQYQDTVRILLDIALTPVFMQFIAEGTDADPEKFGGMRSIIVTFLEGV